MAPSVEESPGGPGTAGPEDGRPAAVTRRRFLGATGGLVAGAALAGAGADTVAGVTGVTGVGTTAGAAARTGPATDADAGAEPFYGVHQAGILTPAPRHTVFASLDVHAVDRGGLAQLLRRWTGTAADLVAGAPGARLTVNVGFGPTLFGLGGPDRFGLADRRPVALVELPAFAGDAIVPGDTGGDLTVHACADEPTAASGAVTALLAAADGAATVRWTQRGFTTTGAGGEPRDPLGFREGIVNPLSARRQRRFVWADAGQDQPWMDGGTYLVVRRIRLDVDHWQAMSVTDQERVVGRAKASGAPLGARLEDDPLDLGARTPTGELVIPADAHVRLASPQDNWEQMLLRRSFSYRDEGTTSPVGTGLLFCAYQVNPRLGFIPMYGRLSAHDALRHVATHTASAVAALPPGVPGPGHWLGEGLLA